MAALGLSRAHDEELLAAAEPDVLVSPWTMSTSTRGRRPAGGEGRLIAADHARRGEIAKDDLRIVAARAGCELELYLGRCLLLVGVCHHLTQGHNLAHVVKLLFPG